jgi:hypothetical protein
MPALAMNRTDSRYWGKVPFISLLFAANKAKAAAEAAYPGGKVDRVVLLSDGEYNVHIIAVNWPHHVFVSKSFKAVGAE